MVLATEVRFTKILGEPSALSFIVESVELDKIIKGIEKTLQRIGFITRNLSYSWNTTGTTKAFIYNEANSGRHLIVEFETRSVRSK